jgi:hypothetical protein
MKALQGLMAKARRQQSREWSMTGQQIEFRSSVLCDRCFNAGKGVKLPGRALCLDCAGDDAELLKEIVNQIQSCGCAEVVDGALSTKLRT